MSNLYQEFNKKYFIKKTCAIMASTRESDATGDRGISVDVGAVMGNTVTNCGGYGIHLISGSIIGNTVFCNAGQTGIRIAGAAYDFTLVDQNSVTPLNGATFTAISAAGSITYGKNTFLPPQ